jgi:hypothetical protein
MSRKFRALLALIVGINCFCIYEDAFSATRKTESPAGADEEESEGEGFAEAAAASGGAGGEAGGGRKLRKRERASSPEAESAVIDSRKFWSNQFNFRLNGINVNTIPAANRLTLEGYSKEKSDQSREFYAAYPTPIHLANVSVIYTTREGGSYVGHRHDFPNFFVSGWTVKLLQEALKKQSSAATLSIARDILDKEHFSLGDCYEGFSKKQIGPAERGSVSPSIDNLIIDFKKRGWNGLSNTSIKSSEQRITHSEQAFISCALRDKLSIPGVVPASVIIVINGRLPPCDTCEKTLRFLMENREFANELINHLFPAIGLDVSGIPLSIIYTASGESITTPELDIHNEGPYFVHGRR